MDIPTFLLLVFATWRLSSLFSREEGPFKMFQTFRIFIYKKTASPETCTPFYVTFYDGLNCLMCNSVWFGAIVALFVARDFFWWSVITLGLSTGAILVDRLISLVSRFAYGKSDN